MRFAYSAAIAIIGILWSLPVTGHDTNANTRTCHTTCKGALASWGHKHPLGNCSESSACIVAQQNDPNENVAAVPPSEALQSMSGTTAMPVSQICSGSNDTGLENRSCQSLQATP